MGPNPHPHPARDMSHPSGPGTVRSVPTCVTNPKSLRAVVCAGAVLALVAGCQSKSAINREPQSGSVTASAVNGVQTVVLQTDARYRFTPDTITVHPGKVKIVLEHTGGGAPHDWQLQGFPGDYVPLTQSGQTRSVEFTAPAPGTYQFICTIHVAQGQTGTLVVLPG